MKLRYPNARLLIFNLLHGEGIRCSEALVKGAYNIGLISKTNTSPNGELKDIDCGSMIAINQIIKSYFDQHHGDMSEEQKAKLVTDTSLLIKKDIENYKLLTGVRHPTHKIQSPIECGELAPATFDFLLQHLHHFGS